MTFRIAAGFALAASSIWATAEPLTCDQFRIQLKTTYGFRPSQLTPDALEEKNQQLDAVWRVVERQPKTLVPCLRATLLEPTDDGWFLFDGAQLLESVEHSADSKRILLNALSRVSLDDVDLRMWVHSASALGLDGYDTSALGSRWLAYPKAEYFLPEHGAYRVDRENGAQFIFGALDERFATPALIETVRTSTGPTKEIAVWILMSQATPQSLQALSKIDRASLSEKVLASLDALLKKPELIEPRKAPRTSRAEFLSAFSALLKGNERPFNHLVESVPDGEKDLVAVVTPADLDTIRKVRRYFATKNSPHAIEYYNQFSEILMTLVWKDVMTSEREH